MRMLRDVGIARSWHVMMWTNASGSTVAERLKLLRRHGLVSCTSVNANLRRDGHVVLTTTPVWCLSAGGYRHLEPVTVPGTGAVAKLGPFRPSGSLIDHGLAVTDALVWARAYGWHTVTERQVRSTEQVTKFQPRPPRYWTVPTSTRTFGDARTLTNRSATHTSDGALLYNDGRTTAELLLEVELASKPSAILARDIDSMMAAGRRQVWHIRQKPVRNRVIDEVLGQLVGVRGSWAAGIWTSTDQQIYIVGSLPGRASLGDIQTLDAGALIPPFAPPGVSGARRVDWSGEWRSRDTSKATAASQAARAERAALGPVTADDSGWWSDAA